MLIYALVFLRLYIYILLQTVHSSLIHTHKRMALTILLFKVADIEIGSSKHDAFDDKQEETKQLIPEENTIFLCAKIIFRGIY